MPGFNSIPNRLVEAASDKLSQLTASGMAPHDAWNAASVNLAKAAEVGRYTGKNNKVSTLNGSYMSATMDFYRRLR